MFRVRAFTVLVAACVITSAVLVAGPDDPVVALPTPGLNCQTATLPANDAVRIIPEAENTNDFIGYFEAKECFAALERLYPDRMKVTYIGKSFGLPNRATQALDRFDVPLIEVTNEKSAIPFDEKVKVVLMLSIHGNEKGGREGGMRVLEDYVRNLGSAKLTATGHSGKSLYNLLDYAVLLLLFPNADGWAWDEPQYADPGTCQPGLYKRQNGHCADLNRQLPTRGWQTNPAGTRKTMNEPEMIAVANTLVNYTNVAYAADIHGMLTPADGCAYGACAFTSDAAPTGEDVYGHFVLGLISAGQLNPKEMLRSTRLANLLMARLNSDPTFVGWQSLPSTSVWGGEYYSWSTVWDTIGYTDSGITGDWFLQDTGLNAPGMDFEMAYNHITFDSVYEGPARVANVYHVQTVRQIARAYLEAAVTDVQTSIETHGKRTAYLYNPKVFTSDTDRPLEGWAKQNPADDAWDYEHAPYDAAPVEYFREMAAFMADGEKPATFEELRLVDLTSSRLSNYENFIVAGSAVEQIRNDTVAMAAVEGFVKGGGNLVLTDESMELLVKLGIVKEGQVGFYNQYGGMTLLVDRNHPLTAHSVKLSRQTYEPVPLGYPIGGSAANWWVNQTAFKAAGGEVVGVVPKSSGATGGGQNPLQPASPQMDVDLGRIKLGSGTVTFLGALLPDPTQDYYHPYGLESYATTYFGNLLLYNMLGAEQVFREPPIVLEDVGKLANGSRSAPFTPGEPTPSAGSGPAGGGSPGIEATMVVLAILGVALGRRRRP